MYIKKEGTIFLVRRNTKTRNQMIVIVNGMHQVSFVIRKKRRLIYVLPKRYIKLQKRILLLMDETKSS